MAGKKENLKALFTNTRTRVIILFTAILLITTVVIGYFKLTASSGPDEKSKVSLKRAPQNLRSIPGSLDQTAQYAALQNQQNVEQAKTAEKKGGSAIPTIIKTQAFGEGVDLVGPQYGEGSAGFVTLSLSDLGGSAKSLWIDELEKNRCSSATIKTVLDKGASLNDLREGCNCTQLRTHGYTLQDLEPVCSCPELKAAGFSAREMRAVGYTTDKLYRCGFSACDSKSAGFSAEEMKDGGYSNGELKGAGFSEQAIEDASGLPPGVSIADVRAAGCDPEKLKRLREKGVSAAAIKRISACSVAQLKAAGYTANALRKAGFSAAELKAAGFSPEELKQAGYSARDLMNAGFSPEELEKAGFSKDEIDAASKALADSASAQLRAAGCSVEALKRERAAGVRAEAIKQAAGCSVDALRAAGYSAQELKDAGYTAAQLKQAGFSPEELKDAGYSIDQLKDAGLSDDELKALGLVAEAKPVVVEAPAPAPAQEQVKRTSLTKIPTIGAGPEKAKLDRKARSDTKELQELMSRQKTHMADQRYQAKLKQISGRMMSAAGQALQNWKNVPTQVFVGTTEKEEKEGEEGVGRLRSDRGGRNGRGASNMSSEEMSAPAHVFIKTGDILFAVLDTAVNTDEPGPILATIVSGKLKGSKLIGSFTLPANADKMVITFNTLSMLGADQTIGISAYAIDPNTARTALSSRVNHHYLMRYGSLFASTFLAGFSSAIQSADTTITIGGTGGTTDTTVQNGINRSLLENALIGLGEVGKAWSETAQQLMNKPTTVELFSGTGMGVLFTQDVQLA